MDNKRLRIPDVLYVPALSNNLYSVSQHIQYQGCSVLAMNNEVIVTFNELVAQAKMDANIYLNMSKTID